MPPAHQSLEQYIANLHTCLQTTSEAPHNLPTITTEYGVYDNYPILLDAHPDNIRDELFLETTMSIIEPDTRLLRNAGHILMYNPAKTQVTILEQAEDYTAAGHVGLGTATLDQLEHYWYQREHFRMQLRLNLRPPLQARDGKAERALATTVLHLLNYAREYEHPLCLPNSRGWHHLHELDRIVYHGV